MRRSHNGSDAPGNSMMSAITDIDHHAMSSCLLSLIFGMRLFFERVISRAPRPS
jgi:hypothetical protein